MMGRRAVGKRGKKIEQPSAWGGKPGSGRLISNKNCAVLLLLGGGDGVHPVADLYGGKLRVVYIEVTNGYLSVPALRAADDSRDLQVAVHGQRRKHDGQYGQTAVRGVGDTEEGDVRDFAVADPRDLTEGAAGNDTILQNQRVARLQKPHGNSQKGQTKVYVKHNVVFCSMRIGLCPKL